MLEAQRQKAIYGLQEDWADEYSRLIDDDAVATVLQVRIIFLLIKGKENYPTPSS